MIKLLLPLLFVFTSTANAAKVSKSATNTLEIKKQDNVVEIELPEIALKLLTQWNPEFIPFNLSDYGPSIIELFNDIDPSKVPMAFIDDLDGDGKKDIVLLGSDLKKQYVVALINNDKKWTLVKVSESSYKDIKNTTVPFLSEKPVIVSGTAKTTEKTVPLYVLQALGEQAVKLKEKKKVGIQVEYYLGAGTVYEIKNNKAVKFTL
ncbi:MAG: hypothetical protein NDI63_13005 [Pseudobdellovibrio sp.]|nr:hypothetical protein [Pseudobdellovibrio sp.]